MALPVDFDDWEHLKKQLIQDYNREVSRHFRGVEDNSIATAKQSVKHACRIQVDDTAAMASCRMQYFYLTCRHAQEVQAPIYALPLEDVISKNANIPRVELFFREDLDDVEEGYWPVKGLIRFRLRNQSDKTITNSELVSLGNKIKGLFGSGGGFRWHKGRVRCCYSDNDKGYNLQVLSYTEAEGQRVIEQVLDIQGHTPDWDRLNISQAVNPSSAYPTNPGTVTILGKSQKNVRKRPSAYVRFQWASVLLPSVHKPVIVYDRTNWRPKALVNELRTLSA